MMITAAARCRFCRASLTRIVVDLGTSPLANAYLTAEGCTAAEMFYPLRAFFCEQCYLVQLEEFEPPERLFSEYAYFSSYSESWVRHAERFAIASIERFQLGSTNLVVEVASNDGYLLQHFRSRGVPVLGVEPAANVARAAETKGIPTLVEFFGAETARRLARSGQQADMLVGNNVLAHVPDLNDFVAGLALALTPNGVLTMEFPHLLRLIQDNQFDTIYHEHFSYFSLLAAEQIMAAHGLRIFDVDQLPTHGGSLRIYAVRSGRVQPEATGRLHALRAEELAEGLDQAAAYASFDERVREAKRRLLALLIDVKKRGKTVVGYGAPAKGNTLLNYCGIRTDFLDYTVDLSPHKQGRFLPGTRIPVHHPDRIRETRPDFVLILPWNLKEEIMAQLAYIGEWGGQFVLPIPMPRIEPAPVLRSSPEVGSPVP